MIKAQLRLFLVILVLLSSKTVFCLNCYTSLDKSVEEDCQMHTGCMKKLEIKTEETVERGCFLTNGTDTCFADLSGSFQVCWCHSDLCNSAHHSHIPNMRSMSSIITIFVVSLRL